jgi:hypothetical protein
MAHVAEAKEGVTIDLQGFVPSSKREQQPGAFNAAAGDHEDVGRNGRRLRLRAVGRSHDRDSGDRAPPVLDIDADARPSCQDLDARVPLDVTTQFSYQDGVGTPALELVRADVAVHEAL